MRFGPLPPRVRTALRAALLLAATVLAIWATGCLLGWWFKPYWLSPVLDVYESVLYQTLAIWWIRRSAFLREFTDHWGRPLLDHWSVRLVVIGVVMIFGMFEMIGITTMFPKVFAWHDLGLTLLTWVPGLGVALFALGSIALGLHYNGVQTQLIASRYHETHHPPANFSD